MPLRVAVACSPRAGLAVEAEVTIAPGSAALDAIRASGLLERYPEIDISTLAVGIWGRPCRLDTPVHSGDRVEIYRPLAMSPKEARRLRAEGARGKARR
ncbi:MAG: RnfH family protein [Caldimonas sp.]